MKKTGLFFDAAGTSLKSTFTGELGVVPYEDALAVLRRIKLLKQTYPHIKTAVITSWGDRIEDILEALKMDQYFDVVIHANRVAHTKPHPDCYLLALQELGIEASSAFHIGDDLYGDAVASSQVGIQGVWLDRKGREPSHDSASETSIIEEHGIEVVSCFSEFLKKVEPRLGLS